MKDPLERRWWIYSPEFKQKALERMKGREKVSALARELGVPRQLLYTWRRQGWGEIAGAVGGKELERAEVDPLSAENDALKGRIAELERLLGQRAGELDFFAAALRNVEELRPSKTSSSGGKSTRRSNRLRKAEQT
jgi:transposase-like protein